MLNRLLLEEAVGVRDWAIAASTLHQASSAADQEGEQWRLGAMASCANVLAQAVTGRDALAQLRELVRLADGHIRISTTLLAGIDPTLFADFALIRQVDTFGKCLLEVSRAHPVFDSLPDLNWALQIDSTLRRNSHPEAASAFLRRLSAHSRFASDGQKAALHAVMTMPPGATLIAALPTGWGKSALFQVGVRRWREIDPTASVVVIVPTIALAQDHARTLASLPELSGSRALVGGMEPSKRQEALAAFTAGDVPILLVSPEMALGGAFSAICEAATRAGRGYDGAHLTGIVIDEAHIISSWGRYFRPDFQRLPGFVRELQSRQAELRTLLLSATLDADLRHSLCEDFSGVGPTAEVVVAEPRNEFDLVWNRVPGAIDRASLVLEAVDIIPRPAIIYTTTVEDACKLHSRLFDRGYRRVELFTGEIDHPTERQRVIDSWSRGAIDLVVATSAFGMGVDKANVRAIVHACLPESAERLYQEIGRGGRDGHQALSLCLWTNGDASTAAGLAIHGWMRPETAVRRWKAILEEANLNGYFSHERSGIIRLKVPLDSRHEGLDRITGKLNRQWNAALLTLLQRSGALRIVSEEQAANGAELWVAEILRPEIVTRGPDLETHLAPFLSIGGDELKAARHKAADLERGLRNREEACFRTLLFDMVEPSGCPWPCGRCSVCVDAGEQPRKTPSRHEFSTPWLNQVWRRPFSVRRGASVVDLDEPVSMTHLGRLVACLSGGGIEQFVTTVETLDGLERSVCQANLEFGFTLILGGDVPPARMPTAVIIGSEAQPTETVRRHCLATFWCKNDV
jgi:ATP-dependent DNA helicase RecQ